MAGQSKLDKWSLALLRVIAGIIFAYHGIVKLFVKGMLPASAAYFAQIGIPLANVSAVLAALAEFVFGVFLIIGLMTRWASLVLMFEMLVAFFSVHLNNGFLAANNGYEFVLLVVIVLIVIFFDGPGAFSLGKNFKSKQLH